MGLLTWLFVTGVAGAACVVGPFAVPVLGWVGFSAAGPVAGSLAAGAQAYVGNVAAGSLFAGAQALAMGAAAAAPVVAAAPFLP